MTAIYGGPGFRPTQPTSSEPAAPAEPSPLRHAVEQVVDFARDVASGKYGMNGMTPAMKAEARLSAERALALPNAAIDNLKAGNYVKGSFQAAATAAAVIPGNPVKTGVVKGLARTAIATEAQLAVRAGVLKPVTEAITGVTTHAGKVADALWQQLNKAGGGNIAALAESQLAALGRSKQAAQAQLAAAKDRGFTAEATKLEQGLTELGVVERALREPHNAEAMAAFFVQSNKTPAAGIKPEVMAKVAESIKSPGKQANDALAAAPARSPAPVAKATTASAQELFSAARNKEIRFPNPTATGPGYARVLKDSGKTTSASIEGVLADSSALGGTVKTMFMDKIINKVRTLPASSRGDLEGDASRALEALKDLKGPKGEMTLASVQQAEKRVEKAIAEIERHGLTMGPVENQMLQGLRDLGDGLRNLAANWKPGTTTAAPSTRNMPRFDWLGG